MRLFTRAYLPILSLIMASVLPFAFPLPAQADDGGYRLLELDGHKVKWGDRRLGVGASISYAFATETLRFDDAINCRNMEPIEALTGKTLSMDTLAREAAAAFRVWESAADLSFHEVNDVRDADIILGTQGRPRGRAFASVSYAPDSQEGLRTIEQSLVCLNPQHEWKVGFDGDTDVYDIRYTFIHEIGHAIGLDHPGPSGQVMGFQYTEAFEDLQPGDLLGVQRLYGPANGLDTRLAKRPAEGYHSNDLTSQSEVSATLGLGSPETSHQVGDCQLQHRKSVPSGTTEHQ